MDRTNLDLYYKYIILTLYHVKYVTFYTLHSTICGYGFCFIYTIIFMVFEMRTVN